MRSLLLTELVAIVVKELRQTFRDKRVLALLLIAPVFQLVVLGFAVDMDVRNVPTLVADEDHTAESRAFAADLLAGEAFEDVGRAERAQGAVRAIERGEATIAVVIPKGFARSLLRETPATVQVLVDGTDSNRGIVSQNALSAFVLQRALGRVQQRLQELSVARGVSLRPAQVRVEPRVLYNPTLDSQHYFVPGVAATLLIVVTLIVTAMGLAREKESGTLEQVMVTPIRPGVLIAGKTIPYAAFGMVDLGLVVVAGALIFGVPLRGDLAVLFLGGLFYLLTTLGGGLLLASLARTQQQAFMMAFFVVMPAVLLSGFVTPIANMPWWLRPFTAFNPARHFVQVMRAVLLKGAGFAELAPQLVALAAIGLFTFALAVTTLRRRLS